MRDKILEEAKRVFKPEFINRLDDIIVFHTLDEAGPAAASSISKWRRCRRACKLKEITIALDNRRTRVPHRKRLRPDLRRATDAPRGRAIPRRSARRRNLARKREGRRSRASNRSGRQTRLPRRRTARQRAGERELKVLKFRSNSSLGTRMRVGVSFLQSLGRDVSVDLRRRETGVA